MNAPESKPWQRGWVIGLALLSLVVPVAAGFLRTEPLGPFADPVRLSYYRQTIVALAIAIACAAGAFVGARSLRSTLFRWLSVVFATLGVLLSAYLILGLIGSCGLPVLWGVCQP
jgi:hypothetical protein